MEQALPLQHLWQPSAAFPELAETFEDEVLMAVCHDSRDVANSKFLNLPYV